MVFLSREGGRLWLLQVRPRKTFPGLSTSHVIKYWELIGERWWMTSYRTTNDLICAKNGRWFRSTCIAHKQFIFSTLLKLQWHAVAQTTQNIWKFMAGKSSLQEIATLAIMWEISDSNLETGRHSLKSGVSRIIRESWQHQERMS